MTTNLHLHHMGEVVVRGLLEAVASGGKLAAVGCKLHPRCDLASVLAAVGLAGPLAFATNVQLQPVKILGATVPFDGAHGVDVVAHDGRCGLGIEAKLGLDRLSSKEFASRFLQPLSLSGHKKPRVKGNMAAVLSYRSLAGSIPLQLRTTNPAIDLHSEWALAIREKTWTRWRASSPPVLPGGHVIVLEEVAGLHGTAADFDALVSAQVGSGFAAAWKVY